MRSCSGPFFLQKIIRSILQFIRLSYIVFTGILFFLLHNSCSNDLETVKQISARDTLPIESARNIEAIYSDSGRTIIYIYSVQMDKYLGVNTYIEFPKGLKVLYYDTAMKVKSMLTADYAIVKDKEHILEAQKNVVIMDKVKDVIINTEHIIWDQQRKIVYSNTFVKKTSKDGVMFGDGFDADETFSRYTVRNPKGEINVVEKEGQ